MFKNFTEIIIVVKFHKNYLLLRFMLSLGQYEMLGITIPFCQH